MLKAKKIEDAIEKVKILLEIYDLTKDKYCNSQDWISKTISYYLSEENNKDKELYAVYLGDIPISFMMINRSKSKISLLLKSSRFENVSSLNLLLKEILDDNSFWVIDIPKTLEESYKFLFKYYGFEKASEDYFNVTYQYGNINALLKQSESNNEVRED